MEEFRRNNAEPSTRLKQAVDRLSVRQDVEAKGNVLQQAAYYRTQSTALVATRTPEGTIVDQVEARGKARLKINRLLYPDLLEIGTMETMIETFDKVNDIFGTVSSKKQPKR